MAVIVSNQARGGDRRSVELQKQRGQTARGFSSSLSFLVHAAAERQVVERFFDASYTLLILHLALRSRFEPLMGSNARSVISLL